MCVYKRGFSFIPSLSGMCVMVEQTFSVNLPFFFPNGNDFGVDECGLGFSASSGDFC